MPERRAIWLTRPLEDSVALAALLGEQECIIAPVMDIEMLHVSWPTTTPDALLVTSRHGATSLASAPAAWRALPVYCVGNSTAEAAKTAGFTQLYVGNGDVMGLLPHLSELKAGTQLCYVSGREIRHSIADLLQGRDVKVNALEVYDAQAVTTLPTQLRDALAANEIGGVVFYSPRSARIAYELLLDAGLSDTAKDIDAYCMSLAVAEAAGALPWKSVQVCHQPNQETMLELIVSHRAATLL